MEEYFSYDEALEERIREDHEVQDFIDKVASRAIAVWSRFYRCLIRWITTKFPNPESL